MTNTIESIEQMPLHPGSLKYPNCPESIPMSMLNEDQARANHGQSLSRLKERGGLSAYEILCNINKESLKFGKSVEEESIKKLNALMAERNV